MCSADVLVRLPSSLSMCITLEKRIAGKQACWRVRNVTTLFEWKWYSCCIGNTKRKLSQLYFYLGYTSLEFCDDPIKDHTFFDEVSPPSWINLVLAVREANRNKCAFDTTVRNIVGLMKVCICFGLPLPWQICFLHFLQQLHQLHFPQAYHQVSFW